MAFFDSTESAVKALVFYGLKTGLIEADDAVFAANGLFDALKFEPDSSFGITADEIHEAMKERGNLDAAGIPPGRPTDRNMISEASSSRSCSISWMTR